MELDQGVSSRDVRRTFSLPMFFEEGYRALTVAAGFVLRPDRGVLRVSGSDRGPWLQGLLTNDVLSLPLHEARYAAYLTPHGRMITDMRVVALEDGLLLEVPRELARPLSDRLEGLIFAEDVQVSDDAGTIMLLEVYGPHADRLLDRHRADFRAVGATVVHDASPALPAWALYVSADRASMLRDTLQAMNLPEVTAATLETVRIEAGIPQFLVDMDEETIPLEAGIEDRAISFSKGCYVGQEIIVRVTQRGGGRVARRLVGLLVDGTDVPDPGSRILSAQRDIGRVTSATRSPALDGPVALGYVHRDFVQPGTRIQITGAGGRLAGATVSSLPLVPGWFQTPVQTSAAAPQGPSKP